MKMAAVYALSELAKEDVPESVSRSYARHDYTFGRDYLIPKPFDPRLLTWVAPAVAKAAIDGGVARKTLDLEYYKDHLEGRLGVAALVTRKIKRMVVENNRARGVRTRVVLPEGVSLPVLRAAEQLVEEGICDPILLGNTDRIRALIREQKLDGLADAAIIDPTTSPKTADYAQILLEKRSRKGVTRMSAQELMQENQYYAAMMVERGDAEAYLSGVHHNYPDAIRPALHVIGTQPDKVLAGVYMLVWRDKSIFLSDATVNIEPTEEQLAQIAIQAHDTAKLYLNEMPRVAMLSFSNFGSNKHPLVDKVINATQLIKKMRPDIEVDGEVQADAALSADVLQRSFGFSSLKGPANVLVFPDLTSGNIAYKLLNKLGGATLIGPLLIGMRKPVNVLQRNSDVEEIVNLVTFTVHRAQNGL